MISVGVGRDMNQHPFLETAEIYWLQLAFLNRNELEGLTRSPV